MLVTGGGGWNCILLLLATLLPSLLRIGAEAHLTRLRGGEIGMQLLPGRGRWCRNMPGRGSLHVIFVHDVHDAGKRGINFVARIGQRGDQFETRVVDENV